MKSRPEPGKSSRLGFEQILFTVEMIVNYLDAEL